MMMINIASVMFEPDIIILYCLRYFSVISFFNILKSIQLIYPSFLFPNGVFLQMHCFYTYIYFFINSNRLERNSISISNNLN